VVRQRRVQHRLRLVEPPQELHPDLRVTPLDLVVHRLADVVEESRPPGQVAVQAQLVGNRLR
jgi:hypothetical protein